MEINFISHLNKKRREVDANKEEGGIVVVGKWRQRLRMRVKKGRGDEWKNIYSAEKAESMLRK